MSRNPGTPVAALLLLAAALLTLSSCPQQGAERETAEPTAADRAAPPAPEASPPEEAPADEPIRGMQKGLLSVCFEGFDTLVFGMSEETALASLPFGLSEADAMVQPDFALEGDTAYLFRVLYSEYPLLEPVEEARDESFGIAVGIWDGKFEYFSIITTPKHLDEAGWGKVVAKLRRDYGAPTEISGDGDGTHITWMDGKGRAVTLVEPLIPDPNATYQITCQSDTWLALFAQ